VALPHVRIQDRLLRLVNTAPDRVNTWIDQLIDRHTAAFSTPEFLKAVRALSARYVEGRHDLGSRSPIDSAGKRAAFAAFYAPLHFVTVRAVLNELGAAHVPDSIIDLGCGTGVVGAAWSMAGGSRSEILGIDNHPWVLDEAKWNWRTLGLSGRTRRDDLDRPLHALLRGSRTNSDRPVGLAFGWSINELSDQRRATRLTALMAPSTRASVLVLEPLARAAAPWWEGWAYAFRGAGGHAHQWKFALELPARLAALDEAAGFRRETVGVRCLWLPGGITQP
jgi:hypothetical protein